MSEEAVLKFHTVVVGGGIAGLYCAMRLADKLGDKARIGLFEASPRFGGRIETVSLDGFNCEFGPMRFELGTQPLLDVLLKKTLGLGDQIQKFPPFQTAVSEWPQYKLADDEKGYNALQLMKLALLRIFKNTPWQSPGNPNNPNDPKHGDWLRSLYKNDKYPEIREKAMLNGVALWKLGFWNALSDVVSHQATLKIRDQANFYHLIPENPNAAEWIIFWLRGLVPEPEGQLYTLKDGSKTITERMLAKLGSSPYKERIFRTTGHELALLGKNGANPNEVRLRFKKGESFVDAEAAHVVLALSRSPLRKLAHLFTPQTQKDLDSVFGFPLLKVFFTADDPWWTATEPVHTQADKMPTRELHYYRKGPLGMVMLYTDRPGTEYWKIYVKGETHDQAEINGDGRLKDRFAKYLAERLKAEAEAYALVELEQAAQAFSEGVQGSGLEGIPPEVDPGIYLLARQTESVEELAAILAAKLKSFGIRDWAREPYGAACHTWKPGVRSADVLGRLKAFRLDNGGGLKNVHVCGEAYCDYNGFIEGSLRSAENVVDMVPKPK